MYGTRAVLVLNLAAFENKKYTANDRTVRMVKSADKERTNQHVRIYPKTTLPYNKLFYYIDTSILLENLPLVKVMRNYVLDSSGVFSISSLVKISMISLISSFSLKLYLNSLLFDQNIYGSCSKVFGNLRESSEIFGKARVIFGQVVENLRKSWKVLGNLRKIVKNVVISMSI